MKDFHKNKDIHPTVLSTKDSWNKDDKKFKIVTNANGIRK